MSDAIPVRLLREDGTEPGPETGYQPASIRERRILPVDTEEGLRLYNAAWIRFPEPVRNWGLITAVRVGRQVVKLTTPKMILGGDAGPVAAPGALLMEPPR